jgi:hypothetical protein
VAAERMIHVAFGQQGVELLPDGLDDLWWECGHGEAPSHRRASRTPRMMKHSMPVYLRKMRSLLVQALRSFYATLPEQCRVEVVEEQAPYERAAASYSHLVERVREVILDGVLGDVESP